MSRPGSHSSDSKILIIVLINRTDCWIDNDIFQSSIDIFQEFVATSNSYDFMKLPIQ